MTVKVRQLATPEFFGVRLVAAIRGNSASIGVLSKGWLIETAASSFGYWIGHDERPRFISADIEQFPSATMWYVTFLPLLFAAYRFNSTDLSSGLAGSMMGSVA